MRNKLSDPTSKSLLLFYIEKSLLYRVIDRFTGLCCGPLWHYFYQYIYQSRAHIPRTYLSPSCTSAAYCYHNLEPIILLWPGAIIIIFALVVSGARKGLHNNLVLPFWLFTQYKSCMDASIFGWQESEQPERKIYPRSEYCVHRRLEAFYGANVPVHCTSIYTKLSCPDSRCQIARQTWVGI